MIPDLRIILLVVAVFGTVLSGFVGYRIGIKVERTEWQTRELAIVSEHTAKLHAANERARDVERQAVSRYSQVDGEYQAKLKEVNRAKDTALAAARARGLSIPANCPNDRGAMPDTAATASVRDGGARAELSSAAADFLVSIAGEADAVAVQLRACQALLR